MFDLSRRQLLLGAFASALAGLAPGFPNAASSNTARPEDASPCANPFSREERRVAELGAVLHRENPGSADTLAGWARAQCGIERETMRSAARRQQLALRLSEPERVARELADDTLFPCAGYLLARSEAALAAALAEAARDFGFEAASGRVASHA